MNIFDATSLGDGVVSIEGHRLLVDKGLGLQAGHMVKIGIRPEHLSTTPDGFTIHVDLVESLGAQQIIHATWGQQKLAMQIETDRVPAQFGQALVVGCAPQHLHVFDAQTGQRLLKGNEQ